MPVCCILQSFVDKMRSESAKTFSRDTFFFHSIQSLGTCFALERIGSLEGKPADASCGMVWYQYWTCIVPVSHGRVVVISKIESHIEPVQCAQARTRPAPPYSEPKPAALTYCNIITASRNRQRFGGERCYHILRPPQIIDNRRKQSSTKTTPPPLECSTQPAAPNHKLMVITPTPATLAS